MLRTTPRQVDLAPGGICVFESRHAPGFQMSMGKWTFDKLCFVREGTCNIVTQSSTTRLRAGDVICLPAMLAHRFEENPESPATLVVICFHAETLGSMPGPAADYAKLRDDLIGCSPLPLGQSHRKDRILTALQAMVFEETTARVGHEPAVWGLFLQLVALLFRTAREATTHERLKGRAKAFAKSIDFLDENFTEPIRLETLAALTGVSYRHYTSLFRAEKGMTVGAYLVGLRVNFAKKRLLETGNIVISGLDAGFDDLSNFYRVFRKATGTTPGRFLEIQKEKDELSRQSHDA